MTIIDLQAHRQQRAPEDEEVLRLHREIPREPKYASDEAQPFWRALYAHRENRAEFARLCGMVGLSPDVAAIQAAIYLEFS